MLILAALLAACTEQSNVDPDASVSILGTVRDVDGSPLESRPVRLGSGVTTAEGGIGVLTVGLFCLSGECSGDFFDTTTAGDGSFELELTGRDTQSAFGEATSLLLSTSAEPPDRRATGPAISARFRAQTTSVALPTLDLIDALPTLESSGGAVDASWDGAVLPAPYTLTFGTPSGAALWEVAATDPNARLDGRVLEDVTGPATVTASRSDEIEGSDVDITWRSSAVAFQGGFGPPPSRGAHCELHGERGLVEPLEECALTDGTFAPARLPMAVCPETTPETPTTDCETVGRVRVVLSKPLPAQLVVVRGCGSPCTLAAVREGDAAATDIGPLAAPFAALPVDEAPLVAVDIVADDLSTLTEVSVWTSTPRGQPLLPVNDPSGLVLDAPSERADGWSRIITGAVAALLLAVVLLLGVTIGRRTRAFDRPMLRR